MKEPWLIHIAIESDFKLPLENMKTRTGAPFSHYINRALKTQLKRDGYLKSEKR
ncbi:hypothetical protein LCGC14_1974870 [marine sediment metagenome]|uniref:Uncharacterized protein n=1 Tax=marine sediment metagenome TaxID=412755 RepID=A0A0F9I7S9_9ZZZZ